MKNEQGKRETQTTQENMEDEHVLFWAAGIETGIALLVVWWIPKRLNRLEVYATWTVMAAITLATDVAGALTFKFYYMASPKPDWQVLIFELLFPPACGIIVANFMPSPRIAFIGYSIGVAILSDFIEWTDVHFRFLTYQHWNLLWSGVVYFLGTIYLRWHLHFIRSQTGKKWP